MTTRAFRSGIRRREDPRLITGRAAYTDDIKLPGMLHAAILRSPYAHANITSIDVEAAKEQPGVVAVYTGADTEGALNGLPCAWLIPGSDLKTPAHPAIATGKVRYVGDAVAVVVAGSRYEAEDALEHVSVDYEPLGVVLNPKDAAQDGAPQLHDDAPNNIAFTWAVAGGDTDEAFAQAGVTVSDVITLQRLIANPMEPRSAIAQWSAPMGELTLWSTTQNPHIARFLTSVVTGVAEHKIRVIAPEVGGGFGSKIPYYPDEAITAFCSMRLGVPVKWTETRSENYLITTQGRDHVEEVEMAATSDGKITGLRTTVYAGLGAYLSTASPGVPTILHGLMYSGPYDIPNISGTVYGVFNNGTPVDAYRGAGRPEATTLIERLVDLVAAEIGADPAEVRRKNFIPKFDNGHDVATGITYDSGDYEVTLDAALAAANYAGLRAEQASRPRRGPMRRRRRLRLRRDLRTRPLAGRRRRRIPGRTLGERHRPLPSHRQGQRHGRLLSPRTGRGDHIRPDHRQRGRRRSRRRRGHPRRHRPHPDGMGHLRQPHHRRLRRRRRRRRPQDQGEVPRPRRPPPRSRDGGHRLRGRALLREGLARPAQDHPGHRPHGERRLEHARGHGARPRGQRLLRPPELHLPLRRARRRRRGRPRHRAASTSSSTTRSTTVACRSTP